MQAVWLKGSSWKHQHTECKECWASGFWFFIFLLKETCLETVFECKPAEITLWAGSGNLCTDKPEAYPGLHIASVTDCCIPPPFCRVSKSCFITLWHIINWETSPSRGLCLWSMHLLGKLLQICSNIWWINWLLKKHVQWPSLSRLWSEFTHVIGPMSWIYVGILMYGRKNEGVRNK